MSGENLYSRLGGEPKLKRIAVSIVDNHLSNATVRARFVASDRDDVVRLVSEFLCSATGGPQTYTGKSMLDAHRGMNISEQEYMAVVDDILDALVANDVGQREQEELLMMAYSARHDILRV